MIVVYVLGKSYSDNMAKTRVSLFIYSDWKHLACVKMSCTFAEQTIVGLNASLRISWSQFIFLMQFDLCLYCVLKHFRVHK